MAPFVDQKEECQINDELLFVVLLRLVGFANMQKRS